MQITCTQRKCKDFEIKNRREYHDLYIQSDTLLVADVENNFRNVIYGLDPPHFFFSAQGLTW